MLLFVSLICQGTLVLAGTTGALVGIAVNQATQQPLAGAKVTAASPSQIVSAKTDASGRFTILNLSPDTYTVSIEAAGFEATSLTGVSVQADQTRTLSLSAAKALTTIGRVTARSATNLVRPGTTADTYSVDATQQAKFSGVGGGAEQNQAYSAIATVPGAFVPQGVQGGNGIGSNVYLRGGDYDQVGFEVDGVPVNRAFDNYPSGPAATLGQQELQVYTGSAPANAEAQGLAGFINQVIKVGSYPSFLNGSASIGGPAFYHQTSIEFGGATKNRNFSYFIGLNGYNQDFRTADQFNGASLGQYGTPLAACTPDLTVAIAPSCFNAAGKNYSVGTANPNEPLAGSGAYVLSPYNAFTTSHISDRDNVINLHFGLPHKDGTKDDIQLLGVHNSVSTQFYDSTNDQGGAAALAANGTGIPAYAEGYQYNGPTGVALPANYQSLASPYLYPQVRPASTTFGGNIAPDLRDAISNTQSIAKLQYTKSLGTNALFKLYGYTFYSDWLMVGPQTAYANYAGPASPDYELSSHTRGLSGTFQDQLGSKNLLQMQGSFTTASLVRDNNTEMFNGSSHPNARSTMAVLVDSSNPLNGICYTSAAQPTTCAYGRNERNPAYAQFATVSQAYNGTITPAPAANCGGGPCEYLVTNNGQYATYNRVKPKFYAASITDQYRPTDKLLVDLGMRLDVFQYVGSNTNNSTARQFWYNAYNLDKCLDSQNNISDKVIDLGFASPTTACPPGYTAANFTNPTGNVTETYPEFQPRLGFTYTLNPTTVMRASYGRYAQAPNSAYEQYDTLQANAPVQLYSTYGFQKFGFTSPDHRVVPQVSNNYDISFEKSFGDTAIKVSPFYRTTQNQIQQFYLNQQTNFVSGLNVGRQTSQGVEFELDKGNFARDGIAAKLSFTYTNSYIKYNTLSNGSTIIDPFNTAVKQYNAYTSYCATHAGDKACGATSTGVAAAPCYTLAGAADAACGAGSVANPYWNAPLQGLFDTNGNYSTYSLFPAGIGTSVAGYGAPYFATFIMQYKHGPLAITPNVQFSAGQRYGAPLSTLGIDPVACTGLTGGIAGDSRYPYGAPGGAGFDATTCGTLAGGIPDPYTKRFDSIGQFAVPSQLQFGTQIQYDLSKRVSLVANFANIINTCFGGSKTGFTVSGACGYGVVGVGTGGDIGNLYNPGAAIQPYVNTPYEPFFSNYPFSVSVAAKFHL